jgi:hypothetical protein
MNIRLVYLGRSLRCCDYELRDFRSIDKNCIVPSHNKNLSIPKVNDDHHHDEGRVLIITEFINKGHRIIYQRRIRIDTANDDRAWITSTRTY